MEIILNGKTVPVPSGTSYEPGDGVTIKDSVIDVKTPVRSILTQEEFDALSDEEQNKGLYVIDSVEKIWWSPKMVANNAPAPYVATASDDAPGYGSSGIFAAFDNNPDTFWSSMGYSQPWIAFDFGKNTKVYGIELTGRTDGYDNQLPTFLTIKGSYDGTNWTDILSESNLPNNEHVKTFLFNNPASFRHYKIDNILSGFQDNNISAIGDIRFLVLDDNSNNSDISTSQDVYSTEETRIGTWIDGKPLYRRVFQGTVRESATGLTPTIPLDGDFYVIHKSNFVLHGNKRIDFSNSYYEPNDNYMHIFFVTTISAYSHPVGIYCTYGSGFSNNMPAPIEVTIEYTKTTD